MNAHPGGFILLVLLAAVYSGWMANWGGRVALVITTAIYLAVNPFFFDLVRDASTHGNTIHGWYSKYNRGEKFIAWAWFVVYPVVAGFFSFWVQCRFEDWQNTRRPKKP